MGKKKHGMCGTRIYRIWADMKTRCNCENNQFYYRYGGRGIKVCKEWEEFIPFYEWAIKNGYSDDLTIDRIDNDGDYCPENCKWSTQHEQSMNKTHIKGETGHIGIRLKDGKFVAEVTRYGKYYYLGRYSTIHAAEFIRNQFLEEHGWA